MSGLPIIRRFASDRAGVAAIEFALIAPVLVLLLLGATTLFVLYRDAEVAEKSTFTLGDMLSRRTDITTGELDVNRAIFVAMTDHPSNDTTLRITSIMRKNDKFMVCWSYAPAPMTAMTTGAIPTASMPTVANGDSVVFVETTVQSTPMFGLLGLPAMTLTHFSAARPRFSSSLKNTSISASAC